MLDPKNAGFAGAHFYSVLMPVSCFISKNGCFGDFSFYSYSVNDK